MAKAVGVTEKELAAMMKSGQLLTDEVCQVC
jgi:tape measure domain-containing protein